MAKFGAKEVMDVTLYNMSTGVPVMVFDSLKTSALSVTSEKVYARGGKGNPKILTWEINKEAMLTIEDALLSPKSLELVSGMATTVGAQTIYMRQRTDWATDGNGDLYNKGDLFPLTCSAAGVINLAFTPKEAATAIKIYLDDDDCGTAVDMTGAAIVQKALTLGANGIAIAGGKQVIAYYTYTSAATASTWLITADKFSGTYKLVGDTVIRNAATGKDEAFQMVCPNLKFSSNLELSFSADGDPTPTSSKYQGERYSDIAC